MGDSELIAIGRALENTICNNNKLCAAERDAKQRGTWFFQMSFLKTKAVKLGSMNAEETVASGAFEVLQFAPSFKELDYYEEDEDHQITWQGTYIYNKLDLISRGEAMAFVKMVDSFSTPLADARQEHRPLKQLNFSLRRFSPKGGVMYKFDLDMEGVFILDIKKTGAAEKILVTFSRRMFGGTMPG